jgi:predicted O-methyltransferase YrrM
MNVRLPIRARVTFLLASTLAIASAGTACKAPADPEPVVRCEKDQRVKLDLNQAGASAVAEPAEEDQNWSPPPYDPLVPSRTDGKPTFSNSWFANNQKVWEAVLEPMKGKPNLRYLEVGVFEGQSFVWMFDNVLTDPSSEATAIDLFFADGLEERFAENIERAGVSDRVTIIKGFSNDSLRPLAPDSFDIIYIDGSHTAANVLRDGLLSWDLLKEGGILIFDDYALTPRFPSTLRPREMIDAIVTAFGKEIEVLHRGWQLILRRTGTYCYDNCSLLGPYEYHWSFKEPNVVGAGTLYDPRTKARVPLTRDECAILETLLVGRPMGNTDLWPKRDVWESAETQALMQSLNLL